MLCLQCHGLKVSLHGYVNIYKQKLDFGILDIKTLWVPKDINSLPNDKNLELSKFKAFADNKIN